MASKQREQLVACRLAVETGHGIGDRMRVRDDLVLRRFRRSRIAADLGDRDFADGIDVADPQAFECLLERCHLRGIGGGDAGCGGHLQVMGGCRGERCRHKAETERKGE